MLNSGSGAKLATPQVLISSYLVSGTIKDWSRKGLAGRIPVSTASDTLCLLLKPDVAIADYARRSKLV